VGEVFSMTLLPPHPCPFSLVREKGRKPEVGFKFGNDTDSKSVLEKYSDRST
jgi:hypothetical protein